MYPLYMQAPLPAYERYLNTPYARTLLHIVRVSLATCPAYACSFTACPAHAGSLAACPAYAGSLTACPAHAGSLTECPVYVLFMLALLTRPLLQHILICVFSLHFLQ
jgi:hypothetical protein